MRKLALALVLLLAFGVGAFAADVPNLVGTWEGKSVMHSMKGGFFESSGLFRVVITEQRGLLFTGYKEWVDAKGKRFNEGFSAIIEKKAEGGTHEVYFAEHEDGLMFGDVDPRGRTMNLYYIESLKDPKALYYDLKKVQ